VKVYKSSGEMVYYMIVYPEQRIAIGVWKDKKDKWRVYKYAGYHNDIHVWMLDSPSPSNTLEILVLSGLTEERLLELALSIPPGLDQVV